MPKVNMICHYSDQLPYSEEEFVASIQSMASQNYSSKGIIVVDDRGRSAGALDFLPSDVKIRRVKGSFANRAAKINAGLKKCTGDYVLMLQNESAQVLLKTNALDLMVMALERNDKAVMVYGDYERIEASGEKTEVHLLYHHAGRLRDTVDYGTAILYRKSFLDKIGGLDESYNAADLYDLRLKCCAKGEIVHISNRYAGSLYTVKAPAKGHNVFDYLLAGKDVQLEMERACTEHLKRIAAYLAPGQNYKKVPGKPDKAYRKCIASVVIPINNRPEFIGPAIESVQAQTVKKVEAIVVINGGPEDTTIPEALRYVEGGDKYDPSKPPVRVIVLDINNIGLCLNTGCRAARGKYYFQLDSDDQLTPDAVEKVLEVFAEDDRIGMVIGSYEVWKKDPKTGRLSRMKEIPVVTHDEWTYENGRNNLLRINGAGAPRVVNLAVLEKMGWFDVNDSRFSRNYGEDYNLVHKISENYIIGRVWDPIYKVIRHAGGTDHSIDLVTIDRNDEAKDWMRLEAIRRRQAINAKAKAAKKKAAAKRVTKKRTAKKK